MSAPTVYMIRHGEKPGGGANGLSAQGEERAQRLCKVFGKEGKFNIGYIIAEHPKKDGSRARPYQTVRPLANDLKDFGVDFNTDIKKHDAVGVARAVKAYSGTGNVLICWEHHNLSDIAEAIGIKGFAKTSGWSGKLEYPNSHFDLIWVAPAPYDEITEVLSEDDF